MTDRRLPMSKRRLARRQADRVLLLEQRRDKVGDFKPGQSQRFNRPPCGCPSDTVESTWTYTLDLTGRTLSTLTDMSDSDGIIFSPLIPADSVITSISVSGTAIAGTDGFAVRFIGDFPEEVPGIVQFVLDMEDPDPVAAVTLPLAISSDCSKIYTQIFPNGIENDESTVEDLVLVVTFTTSATSAFTDVVDTWPPTP